jgi:hypothetical protein
MPWDVERFASHTRGLKQGEGIEKRANDELVRLSKYFSLPDQQQDWTEPGTILDCHGRIMVWFLPGILSKRRVVSCLHLFLQISPPHYRKTEYNNIAVTLSGAVSKSTSKGSWRMKGFNPPEGEAKFGAGVLHFSPASFMQAQNVSVLYFNLSCAYLKISISATS